VVDDASKMLPALPVIVMVDEVKVATRVTAPESTNNPTDHVCR
jgi:hypothetical protein